MTSEAGRLDAARLEDGVRSGLEALAITTRAVSALAERTAPSLAAAAELILDRPGSVVVTGLGKSGLVGAKLAATLASTGTPSLFVHAADALHGDSGMVRDGDVLLALTNSGETEEVDAFARLVASRGVPVIAITGCGGRSTVASRAAVVLDASVEREADPFGLAPTASTSVSVALGDALAVTLMVATGFGPEDFRRSHPGGALGRSERRGPHPVGSAGTPAPEVASADVCVVGSFMMDLVVRTPKLPAVGETVIGESVQRFLGGKGFNQAVAAARSGATTAMVGRVGQDESGDRFLDALAREGIGAEHVRRDDTTGTGTGLPMVDLAGSNSIVVVPLANDRCGRADISEAHELLSSSEIVLAQLELPVDTVAEAFRIARANGVMTVLDPAPAPGRGDLECLAGLVDLVVPNESEAEAITGGAVTDPAVTAAAVADALGGPTVVLTLGRRGALIWQSGHAALSPGHVVDVVDTVGAGDAFCGAMVAALSGGSDLSESVRRANAAGALATTTNGAEPSMPTLTDIRGFLRHQSLVASGART